jgi:hypothetical protein
MKIPTEKERDAVLNKLREAVVLQLALWNTSIEIAKALHGDFGDCPGFCESYCSLCQRWNRAKLA